MPSFVVVGASRGIGHALIQHFAADSSNTVVGLARTPSKVTPVSNAHFLHADMTSFESLQTAATEVGKLTGNKLDYLFINGAYLAPEQTDNFYADFTTPEKPYSQLQHDFNMQMNTNVFGVINSVNAFLPLIQAGSVKKVILISSGAADDNLTRDFDVWENATYSVAKNAANTVIAKYSARYGKALPAEEQILFLAMCPGVVDTGGEMPTNSAMPAKFMKYAPDWKGPIQPEDSVKKMMKVIDESSVGRGDGGRFVSHTGTNKWL